MIQRRGKQNEVKNNIKEKGWKKTVTTGKKIKTRPSHCKPGKRSLWKSAMEAILSQGIILNRKGEESL